MTGGNTGLGQAFTLALAKAGADVFAPSIVEDDGATRALVEAEGVRYESMKADITAPGAPGGDRRRLRRALRLARHPRQQRRRSARWPRCSTSTGAQWDATVAVNLTAAFEMSYEAAQRMVPQRHGKIINICSFFSFLGGRWSSAYAATKHGLAGFTKAYCDELAEHDIQVNGIAPGYYATEITTATRSDPETNRRVLDHIPAARWGDPADLMGTVVFLASRASDYVNGHVLVVDGGYLVR